MNSGRVLLSLCVLLIGIDAQAQEMEPAEEQEQDETPLDVETILTTPTESAYTESPRCLSTARIRRTEVLDERHIVFHMSRDQFLLVEFPRRCPMMDKNSAVMYEVQGSRLCRLDRIRAVNGAGMSRVIGPVCMIPGFKEINVQQVALIRESLEELRRNRGTVPESPPENDTSADDEVDTEQDSESS